MGRIHRLQSKYLVCSGWGGCPTISWAIPTRITLSYFCSTLINFQIFGWHDDMRPWKSLCNPSTLLLVRGNSLSVPKNIFEGSIEKFDCRPGAYLRYLRMCRLQSNGVDHLHLYYRRYVDDLPTLENLGSHHLVIEMRLHLVFSH